MSEYDSAPDTVAHIRLVQDAMGVFVREMVRRALDHDASKLLPPEKEAFDRETPLLRGLTYGSPEYHAGTARLGDALAHHYAHNSHHPQFFVNGIAGMTLIDLVEMFCDWAAAVQRHADGELARSIEINRERFGISDQLAQILENTRIWLQS